MVFLIAYAGAWAQQPVDSLEVSEVLVKAERQTLAPAGYKTIVADSITLAETQTGSLGDVLASISAIYLKSYGSSGLAVPSFRGMGAYHTKILWNDLPLNSSMNGQIDLNTLPAALFNNVEIQYGNGSLLTGSGGIGGGVALQTQPDWNNRFAVDATQEFASFHTYKTALHISGGSANWQSKTGIVFNKSKNDFAFENTALFGHPVQTQQDAEFIQAGASQEVYGRLPKGHQLAIRTFFTWSDRNLSPTMISTDQHERQKDIVALANVEWKYRHGKHLFKDDIDYKYDLIDYTNQVANISDPSHSHTFDHIFSYQAYLLRNLSFSARMENQVQMAFIKDYANGKHLQAINGLYAGAQYSPAWPLTISLSLRQEMVDAHLSPFLPALAVQLAPIKHTDFKLYANVYRNYRYPTLNDRYWSPGGNSNLKEEKAFGMEGGMSYNQPLAKNKLLLGLSATGYTLWVNNWILWQPVTANIWSPMNVQKVWSRGVDASISLTYKKGYWLFDLKINYQYNVATVQQSDIVGNQSVGKDLIYAPRHSGNASARVDYRGWYLHYVQTLTGKRFTSTDNAAYSALDAFTTADVTVGKNIHRYVPGLGLTFTVHNIANTQYQNIAWRPMPGRYYSVQINYTFQKPLKP